MSITCCTVIDNSQPVCCLYLLQALKVLPQTSVVWQRGNSMTARTVFAVAQACMSSPSPPQWPVPVQGFVTLFTKGKEGRGQGKRKEGREEGREQGRKDGKKERRKEERKERGWGGEHHLSASQHLPCHHFAGDHPLLAEVAATACMGSPCLWLILPCQSVSTPQPVLSL